MSELIKVEDKTILDFFSEKNGLDPVLDEIKSIVSKFEPCLETATSRKEIASMANKVAKSKTYIDGLGKDLVSEWKEKSKRVDNERKRVREELDKLKEEVRKPLTEWENKEKERVRNLELKIESLKGFLTPNYELSSESLKLDLDKLESIIIDESWEEYGLEALNIKEKALINQRNAYEKILKQEKEQAELERLRKEKEERDRKDYEEKLKKEAAEKAKLEAEKKAQEEKERAEQERKDAEIKAKLEKERFEREKKEQEETIKRLEKEKIEAAKKAKEEAEKRQREEAERIKREKLEREKNIAHTKKIMDESVIDLVAIGISPSASKSIVNAIKDGKVRNILINF